MKRFILFISLACFVGSLFGQGFFHPIDTFSVERVDVEELSTGDLLIRSTQGIGGAFNSHIISNDGEKLSQFEISYSSTAYIHQLSDHSSIIINDGAFPGSPIHPQIHAEKYDSDNQLVWRMNYSEIDATRRTNINSVFLLEDGFVVYGSRAVKQSQFASQPYIFRIDFDGVLVWEIELDMEGEFFSRERLNLRPITDFEIWENEMFLQKRFIAGDQSFFIGTDGGIIPQGSYQMHQEIDPSFLPNNVIEFVETEYHRKMINGLEIVYSEVRGTYLEVDVSTNIDKEKYFERAFISAFQDAQRQWSSPIWRTDPSNVHIFEHAGNVLFISSNGEVLILGSYSGSLIDGEYIEGFYSVEDVFYKDDLCTIVGVGFDRELKFTKLRIDNNKVNLLSTELTQLPYPLRFNSIKSVIELSNGGYAGVSMLSSPGTQSILYPFRANSNGVIFTNEINGTVVGDLTNDCNIDSLDVNLNDWEVIASGSQIFHSTTNSDGSYSIQVDTGQYDLRVVPRNDYWLNCDTTEIEFTNFFDTLTNADLITSAITPCSFIEVDVGFGFLRRCFSNRVVVQYCNQGTFAEEEAMIELNIDSFLDIDNTSIPIADQQDTTLFFDIGEVGIGDCGNFSIWVTPNCDNTILGQEHCIDAHVFPDTLCVPQDSLWSGANVVVEAICEGDSIFFSLTNIGGVSTADDLTYIVIVDDIIVSRWDNYSLEAGETIQFVEYEPGSTVKVIAEQEPFHPLGNQVGAEAFCTGTDFDFISSFNQYDDDPFTDMVCVENRGSYDPNDKSAIPVGAGAEHYISASQDLEYKIRFQNTGTDTAFTVVIRDTITSELDMTSFEAGIGSHDYTLTIEQGNIIVFTFDNILLPDSTTNLVESNGFVEFKINQVDGNLPSTLIENTAAIYFDFNDPIITNTVFHTIERPVTFSMMSVDLCANEMYEQVLYTRDTTISVLHASQYLDSFAIVDIHLLPVDSTIQYLNVESGTLINETLITMDTIMYEVLTNSFGCDSILVKDITIENVNAISLVDKNHWKVFPNPTKENLSIETSQSFTDDMYTVSVMNIVGTSVYEQDHKISPNENLNLDLRNLSAGTYLLNIASKHGMITEKIVVNP